MPKKVDTYAEARLIRIDRWSREGLKLRGDSRLANPKAFMEGMGDRSNSDSTGITPMDERFLSEADGKDASIVLDPDAIKTKAGKKADYVGTYYGHRGVIRPEYDMLEPFVLVDTEAYLKQAIKRRLSLIMRNGYTITSEKPQYNEYITRRLNSMEFVSTPPRPINNFLRDLLFNLSLSSNCFLLKIRDEKGSGVPKKAKGFVPIAGYMIIPAHQIFPYLENGVIQFWRRYYDTGRPFDDYQLSEIIHLKWDCKPGHIYGTPRTIAVRDDIFALRRLEENIELLFVNFLFPTYHVKVGTVDAPCTYHDNGISEIDLVRQAMETTPKEGVFVTDERVTVEAVGAEGKTLDFKELITHLKNRVFTGLGVASVDMGEGDSVNKSTADNISQVLKDALKDDIDHFAGQIRLCIFKELFQEANISLSLQAAVAETKLEFHEVDMDNRIKEENHTMEKFNNNMINHDESRRQLKMKPMPMNEQKGPGGIHHERFDKDLLHYESELTQKENDNQTENEKSLNSSQITVLKAQGELEKTKASAHTVKANNQKSVLEHKAKHMPTIAKAQAMAGKGKKSVSNKTRPANQHGKKLSPKKKADQTLGERIYNKLLGAFDLWDKTDPQEWTRLSAIAIDGGLLEATEDDKNLYTNQLRTGLDHLKQLVSESDGPDMFYLLVNPADEEENGTGTREDQSPSDQEYDTDSSQDSAGAGDSGSDAGLATDEEGTDASERDSAE